LVYGVYANERSMGREISMVSKIRIKDLEKKRDQELYSMWKDIEHAGFSELSKEEEVLIEDLFGGACWRNEGNQEDLKIDHYPEKIIQQIHYRLVKEKHRALIHRVKFSIAYNKNSVKGMTNADWERVLDPDDDIKVVNSLNHFKVAKLSNEVNVIDEACISKWIKWAEDDLYRQELRIKYGCPIEPSKKSLITWYRHFRETYSDPDCPEWNKVDDPSISVDAKDMTIDIYEWMELNRIERRLFKLRYIKRHFAEIDNVIDELELTAPKVWVTRGLPIPDWYVS